MDELVAHTESLHCGEGSFVQLVEKYHHGGLYKGGILVGKVVGAKNYSWRHYNVLLLKFGNLDLILRQLVLI